jgi:hypothetical protein
MDFHIQEMERNDRKYKLLIMSNLKKRWVFGMDPGIMTLMTYLCPPPDKETMIDSLLPYLFY